MIKEPLTTAQFNELCEQKHTDKSITCVAIDIGYFVKDYDRYEINLTTVLTQIIKYVGTNTQRYADDMLFNIECVKDYINDGHHGVDYVWFGIRKSGVDSLPLIQVYYDEPYETRKKEASRYLSMLCARIEKSTNKVSVELYDMTSVVV